MDEPTPEDLLKRLFVSTHAMMLALRSAQRFDEWSAMEVFAMRAFQAVPNRALGANELAERLRCSVSYASRLMKRMRAKGMLRPGTAYRRFRSMVLTEDGLQRLRGDAQYLEAFARCACEGITDQERRHLLALLGRISANVRA